MAENLLERLKAASALLPKKQRKICEYILSNPLEASTMTIAECSSRLEVATTTILRLIGSLGYDSYSAFKRDLRRSVFHSTKRTYPEYVEVLQKDLTEQGKQEGDGLLDAILDEDIEVLRSFRKPELYAAIQAGARAVLSANRVFLLGLRSSRPFADQLEMELFCCMDNVHQLSLHPDLIPDTIYKMDPQDLLLVVGCHPYAKGTADAIRLCRKRNVPILLITSTERFSSEASYVIAGDGLVGSSDPFALHVLVSLLTAKIRQERGGESDRWYRQMEQGVTESGIAVWDNE